MEIIVSGRHLEVTEEPHAYVEDKAGKLVEEDPKLTSIRVVLWIERQWQNAEVNIHGKLYSAISFKNRKISRRYT